MIPLFLAFAAAVAPVGAPHVYKSVAGRDLKLYVMSPQGDGPFPAAVFYHGGGWVGGVPSQFNQQAARLVERGMVAIQVEYRLLDRGGSATPEVCIRDAKSAMRWVRANAAKLRIDAGRIAAGGGSAGGHLAAFLGTTSGMDDPSDDLKISAKPNAMLLYNPVFDNGPTGFGSKTIGDRYREFSPFHNIARGMPPAIVFVGSEDKLLPVATVKSFCEQARAAGTRCEYRVYDGQPHGFFNYREGGENKYFRETLGETEKFLESLGWIR